MEANCDNNQFDEKDRVVSQSELKAENCMTCGGNEPDRRRPCGNRPGMRPCGRRPDGMRKRPGYYGGRPGSMRPGIGNCGDGPCGARPCKSCGNGLPSGWRPADGMRSNSVSEVPELHSDWNCGNRTIKDSYGNNMMVSCEGQTMSGCYMNDPMDGLGDAFPPVMSYVPWQQWGDLYDPDRALYEGTVFKDLNYIFCGTRC